MIVTTQIDKLTEMMDMKCKSRQFWLQKAMVYLLIFLLGAGIAGTAFAADNALIDPDRTDGSITLNMHYTENKVKKNLTGGEVSIYTVASVKEEDGYHFDVSAGKFAGVQGVSDIPSMNSEQLSEANFALAKKLESAAAKAKADSTQKIADGKVSFTDLKPGLYLIVQTTLSDGDRKVNPFLISIPDENGVYQIEGDPKPGVYSPTPPGDKTPDKTPSKTPSGSKLPQTGQLWWPVPILAGCGIFLILLGIWMSRREVKTI